MKILAFDSSSKALSVAVVADGILLGEVTLNLKKNHSTTLMTSIDFLMAQVGLEAKELDRIAVAQGPGSYTGVRVAMTIAKTLAAVSDVKIKSVSSLAAYAGMNQALSVIDARGHKVFVGVYENGLPLIKEQVMTLEDFAQLRAEYSDYELVGEIGCLGLDEKECDLCANIYALGQMADPIENVDLLVPTYIKDVEAKKACY